jgi:TonB dependent receptor
LSRIDPVAKNIIQYYPLPNLPGITNNYAVSGTRASTPTKYYGRVDENIGNSNHLFFRYGVTHSPASTPGYTAQAFPQDGTNCQESNANSSPWVMALSDTVTFRPNIIGEFRVSYTRQLNTCKPRSLGFDVTTLGLRAYMKNASLDRLFPTVDITDLTSVGLQRESHYVDAENTPEAQSRFTWLRGSHSIKTGIDYLFLAFNIFRPDYSSGNFSFTRAYTQGPHPRIASTTSGFGLATMLLGAPTGGSFSIGPSLAASQRSYNIYLQDDWKITRNLTLNLGARWEYQTPYEERYNQLAFFSPTAVDPITGRHGVLQFTNSSNRYQSIPNQTDIAPRVGLAYTFMKNTVFRAGYGWFYLPGSGGIGASPGDLVSGSQASTPVYLGPPQAAPNTPPVGASLSNPFVSGLLAYPNTLIGNGISAVLPSWQTPLNQQWNASFPTNDFQ